MFGPQNFVIYKVELHAIMNGCEVVMKGDPFLMMLLGNGQDILEKL